MPDFDTQHGSIYYEVLNATGRPAGAAPDLMLLHNFMSTGRATWGPMLDSLFLRYRILLPDLPGHGRSIGHPEGFDHGIIAQQLAALMHAVGAADGHLAGCSSGGMIAQLLMHHRLVNPASLILVSTTYSTNPHVIGALGMAPENFTANDTSSQMREPKPSFQPAKVGRNPENTMSTSTENVIWSSASSTKSSTTGESSPVLRSWTAAISVSSLWRPHLFGYAEMSTEPSIPQQLLL